MLDASGLFHGRRLPGLVLGLALTGCALAGWLWQHRQPNVTVQALLRVAAKTNDTDDDVFLETQIGLIKTHPVLQAALRHVADLDVVRAHSDSLAWLERSLKVDVTDSTEIVRVALTGEKPQELAAVVNAVVDAYLKDVVDGERRQLQAQLDDCERLSRDAEEFIQQKNRGVYTLRQRSVNDLPGMLARERLTVLQKEWEQLTTRLDKAKLKRDIERQKLPSPDEPLPEHLVEEQLARDPAVLKLLTRKARLAGYIAGYEKNASDSPNPLVTQLLASYRADLQAIERQLEPLRRDMRARLEPQWRQAIASAPGLKQLDEEIKLWTEEEKVLRQRLDVQVQELDKMPRNPWLELDRLLKEIERKQEFARKLGRQCEALRQELMAPPRVTLLQRAAE